MKLSSVQFYQNIPKSLSGQTLTYLSNSKWCNPDNAWLNAGASVPRLIIGLVAIPVIAAVGAVYHLLSFLGCGLQGKGTRAIQHLGSMGVDILRCLPGPASLVFAFKPSLYAKQKGRPELKQIDPKQVELAVPCFAFIALLLFFSIISGELFFALPCFGLGGGDVEKQKRKQATDEDSSMNLSAI